MNLSRCVEMFLTEKRLGNLSNKTIDSYQYTIGKFVNYLESQDDDVDTTNLHLFVKPYLLHLQDSSKSPITYNTLLRGLGVFLRFLHTEGFVDEEIKLPKIKNIQSSIHPLTPDQIRKIFNSFDTSNFGGLRNKVIFSLMLDTGIRLSELSGLEMEDVDLNEGYMVVRGKGRKERYVPFGKSIRKLLWTYMKQRSKYSKEGVFSLFITQTGTSLSRGGVGMIFKRLKKKLNLPGRFHPHLLRHSFAVNYINNGGDSFSLQRILGHTTQAMTSRYVTLSTTNIKNQHQRFSPMDRI